MIDAPGIDDDPDLAREALQALRPDSLYFNVAGSGPTFPVAQRAAERYRTWLNGVGMFSHVGFAAYDAALAETRDDIAAALGHRGGGAHVALAQSATDALNTVVAGMHLREGAVIVTTAEEHASALLPVYRRQQRGDRVHVLRYADDVSFLASLDDALAEGAAAVVMSLVSCKNGKVLPAAEACRRARAAGAVAIVDAAQALGQGFAVDVNDLGADAVVVLGHKWLHGPLATGALWVRDMDVFEPLRLGWRSRTSHDLAGGMTLHEDARRLESGTVDVAAFVGLRQALAVQRALGPRVGERVRALRRRLVSGLAALPFTLVSRADDPTGIVTAVPDGADAAGIVTRMWTDERVVVKHLVEPALPEAIRISFWALHDDADVDALVDAFARQMAPQLAAR